MRSAVSPSPEAVTAGRIPFFIVAQGCRSEGFSAFSGHTVMSSPPVMGGLTLSPLQSQGNWKDQERPSSSLRNSPYSTGGLQRSPPLQPSGTPQGNGRRSPPLPIRIRAPPPPCRRKGTRRSAPPSNGSGRRGGPEGDLLRRRQAKRPERAGRGPPLLCWGGRGGTAPGGTSPSRPPPHEAPSARPGGFHPFVPGCGSPPGSASTGRRSPFYPERDTRRGPRRFLRSGAAPGPRVRPKHPERELSSLLPSGILESSRAPLSRGSPRREGPEHLPV